MFVAVGLIGFVLLVAFLLFDDVLDGVLPDTDWISGPALGAFMSAFGLFGWVAQEGFDAPDAAAVAVGAAGGVALGWFAVRFSRALVDSPTDETPNTATLVGREGRVVTAITAGHAGEVLLRLGGQPIKMYATADDTVTVGTDVVVIAVTSDTRVRVQPTTQFWALDTPTTNG